jgi:hypothetical protein
MFGYKSQQEFLDAKFIDRYNMHFKLGESFGIKFTEEEQVYVNLGHKLETWDDAVALMHDMDKFIKEQKKEENNKKVKTKEKITIQGRTKKSGKSNGGDGTPPESGDVDEDASEEEISQTQDAMDELTKELVDLLANEIANVYATPDNWKKHIISYESILKECKNPPLTHVTKYQQFSRPYIEYMVQKFNLDKNASELQQVSFNRTGNLDLDRIHEYLLTDDLFMKELIQPKGKSHGLVIFLDWSGSMQANLMQSLYQCFFVVDFCKKLDIPFDAYCFTSSSHIYHNSSWPSGKCVGNLVLNSYYLGHIFSDKMTARQHTDMQSILFSIANQEKTYKCLPLGGTPLCETILAAMEIVPLFKAEHKLDIVNICFVTDGQGSLNSYYYGKSGSLTAESFVGKKAYLHDRKTKYVAELNDGNIIVKLLDLLKYRTGSNIVGFFLSNSSPSGLKEKWIKDGFATVEKTLGYTEFHVINHTIININPGKIALAVDKRIKFILSRFIALIT